MVAAAPTVAVVPAAADEVSASIAHLFSQHAAGYQGAKLPCADHRLRASVGGGSSPCGLGVWRTTPVAGCGGCAAGPGMPLDLLPDCMP
jgi:hypothetical protein